MTRRINQVAVLGLGKIGELVASLLGDAGFKVQGYDLRARPDLGFETSALDVGNADALREALRSVDAVVTCLPYDRNTEVAEAAAAVGCHYFDLTEDVPTTQRVMELAQSHQGVAFAPQCGLAPGLIGIVGSSLARTFEEIRSIELKVGALPQHPTGLLAYAFNWSPVGVVNEYLNDCEVVRSGRHQMVPAMEEKERVVIGGTEFEAALTSGGLGTMCRTYESRVQRLDYKTLRYPGHFEQMRFLADELGLRDDRDALGRLLIKAKPPVEDDIVYLHAAVEGVKDGQPFRQNHVRGYLPIDLPDGRGGSRRWRAISWTTASSVVGVVELVADGRLPANGFIRQEDIALADLHTTHTGRRFVDHGRITA